MASYEIFCPILVDVFRQFCALCIKAKTQNYTTIQIFKNIWKNKKIRRKVWKTAWNDWEKTIKNFSFRLHSGWNANFLFCGKLYGLEYKENRLKSYDFNRFLMCFHYTIDEQVSWRDVSSCRRDSSSIRLLAVTNALLNSNSLQSAQIFISSITFGSETTTVIPAHAISRGINSMAPFGQTGATIWEAPCSVTR